MKNKALLILVILLGLLFTYLAFRKTDEEQLGKVKVSRPPKIRIVYSRKQKPSDRFKITNSETAVQLLRQIWSNQIEVREEFILLLLDRNNRVLGYELLSKGGISGTVADIRLIFSVALKALASGIVLAHNHPSGNLNPSIADEQITKRIKEAGNTFNIPVLDHIIITKETYYSFADNGKL